MTQMHTSSVKRLASKHKHTLSFFLLPPTYVFQKEKFKNTWHMHTYINTKGEINNRSFVATPCQKAVGVFQKLSSSFNTALHTHDQHVCPCLSFFSLSLSFSWPGGQVMSLVRTEGNTETWIQRIGEYQIVWGTSEWCPYCSDCKHPCR